MATSKKTVLITGCTVGGAGNALAKEFQSRGFQVIVTGRSAQKIAELKELGIDCVIVELTNTVSIRACHEEVKKILGDRGLDFLINNAGTANVWPTIETSMTEARRIMDVNFFAAVEMNQVFLPELRKAQGTIIHIGTVATFLAFPLYTYYCASKSALYAYSNSLRQELKPLGVTVRHLSMASVNTAGRPSSEDLPETSDYVEINDTGRALGVKLSVGGMPPEKYAKDAVSKIIGGPSWWRNDWEFYSGEGATFSWLYRKFNEFWPWDFNGWVLARVFSLNKIGASNDSKKMR